MKQPNLFQRLIKRILAMGKAPRVQVAVLPTENVTVTCLGGTAWITLEDDRTDYVLSRGNRQTLDAKRHPVISVDAGSRIEIHAA